MGSVPSAVRAIMLEVIREVVSVQMFKHPLSRILQ